MRRRSLVRRSLALGAVLALADGKPLGVDLGETTGLDIAGVGNIGYMATTRREPAAPPSSAGTRTIAARATDERGARTVGSTKVVVKS